MSELSPHAQAVLDAVREIAPAPAAEIAATALRVAAEQVTVGNGSRRNNEIRAEIIAIADEIEAR